MKPTEHRTLYNGDCNYLFAQDYRPADQREGPYNASALDTHVDLLADSGVDTYVINPNGQVPWYPSRALDHVLTGYTRGDRDYVSPNYPPVSDDFPAERRDQMIDIAIAMLDRLLDLQEAGVDWIAHLAQRARQRGVSPWASIRMNDAHGANSWETSFFNSPPQRDPRYRLKGIPLNPKNEPQRAFQVCDFSHQCVRDYYLTLARELIEDYDFDGIELDWIRYPACCDPTATQQQIDLMTQWTAEVRAIANARKKRCFLGLRIPARLGALRTIGIDVVAMARQGILDFVTLSNFWQTTWDIDYHALRRQLGDDVAIYGGVEGAPNWMFARAPDSDKQYYRLLPTSDELIRGNAAGKLAAGADGIETFNWFCSDVTRPVLQTSRDHPARYEILAETKSLDAMRGKAKHYALSTTVNFWTPRYFESAGQIPALIETGGWKTFHLHMASEPGDAELTLRVQVIIDRTDAPPDLGVSLNGCWPSFDAAPTEELILPTGPYTHHVEQHMGLNYTLPLSAIRDGINELIVYHGSDEGFPFPDREVESVRIVAVELAVT